MPSPMSAIRECSCPPQLATCIHTGACPKTMTQQRMLDRKCRTSEVIVWGRVIGDLKFVFQNGPTRDHCCSYDDPKRLVRQGNLRVFYSNKNLESTRIASCHSKGKSPKGSSPGDRDHWFAITMPFIEGLGRSVLDFPGSAIFQALRECVCHRTNASSPKRSFP